MWLQISLPSETGLQCIVLERGQSAMEGEERVAQTMFGNILIPEQGLFKIVVTGIAVEILDDLLVPILDSGLNIIIETTFFIWWVSFLELRQPSETGPAL